jgi:ubiquinone/menaquinone biosynthesis C-methylase UbiE
MKQAWKLKAAEARIKRPSPFAPDKSELKAYESGFKLIKDAPKNALILGATPEIRDMAIKHGFKAHAVDLSKKVLKKYSSIMKYKNHKNNIAITKNWLNMKFKDNFFGIILGDMSLNNLATKKDNLKLVKLMKKMLVPKGIFATRHFLYLKTVKPMPLKKLIKAYRDKKITYADLVSELRSLTYKDKVYNKKTFQYDAKKNFDLIDQDYKKGLFTEKEYKKIAPFRNNLINTFYPEDKFISLFENKGFKLKKRIINKKHRFYKFFPVYIFQKK